MLNGQQDAQGRIVGEIGERKKEGLSLLKGCRANTQRQEKMEGKKIIGRSTWAVYLPGVFSLTCNYSGV